MKTYQYYEFDKDESLLCEITEEEILEDYWNYWSSKMIEKYGYGHELITKENCVQDWIVCAWGWEKKDEN